MDKPVFSSYEEVLVFLFDQLPMYQRVGPPALKYDLSNISHLMAELDRPHEHFPSIHIAGTNGKGSTAHLLSAAFQMNGYRTGLYTSPHYRDFRERIRVDGEMIDKPFMLRFMNEHFGLIESLKPSYFELSVALAFHYFRERKVDIAIIEVGLGGRLDSTNIITPLLSVITNISLDHTQTLGDTLEAIAVEKAGIIKPGIPVLIGEKQEETSPVFLSKSNSLAAPLYFAEELVSGEQVADYETPDLGGPFLYRNLRTTLGAIQVFSKHYPAWKLEKGLIRDAFKRVRTLTSYLGRWAVINQEPKVIADGAHNTGSWSDTVRFLAGQNFQQLHMVIGFVKDKNTEDILAMLPKNARYYFCQAQIPRALDASELRQRAGSFGLFGHAFPSVREAYEQARYQAGPDDMIFIGGSIFVVGEII